MKAQKIGWMKAKERMSMLVNVEGSDVFPLMPVRSLLGAHLPVWLLRRGSRKVPKNLWSQAARARGTWRSLAIDSSQLCASS
jgi:hypothetical protein